MERKCWYFTLVYSYAKVQRDEKVLTIKHFVDLIISFIYLFMIATNGC